MMSVCMAFRASLVAQAVKHLPAMQETRDRFLGQEDPLEKEMAIHSSTFTFTSKEVCYPTGTSSLYPPQTH